MPFHPRITSASKSNSARKSSVEMPATREVKRDAAELKTDNTPLTTRKLELLCLAAV
ncbi:hypothetical protein EV682_1051 [Iodobacter fluviatilis]|uniref:Uncharacterized protein n=1 Tax=Iodobacter fluviatilis TaxID=537 RepID=A0A377Q5Y1_9NEIS|nr:hypothetical protein EV682_1051 [Iodobacter fluviatilis]STQ90207.1 Uncharacterised protein [Iodobacter fluviatilis]